jgi:hypothetical protein
MPGERLCLWHSAACKARAFGRARSALRNLTVADCLNAANAVSAVSSATAGRPRTAGESAYPPTTEPKR